MEDVLKALLDTELQAEALVKEADARYQQLLRDAHAAAQNAEREFIARLPALYQSQVHKINERAAQTIAELRRSYEERRSELRAVAEKHEHEAIEATLALITDPVRQ